MGFTKNATITDAGRDLLGRVHSSDSFRITRAVAGDGEIGSIRPAAMTAVASPVMELPAARVSAPIDGQVTLRIDATDPDNIPRDFYFREIGIYAFDNTLGKEILYIYNNAGQYADYVQKGGATLRSMSLPIKIGAASSVEVTLDKSVMYATSDEIEAVVADLSKKASVAFYIVTIPTSGWSGSAAPYDNDTIAVPGILESDRPDGDLIQTGNEVIDSVMRTDFGYVTRMYTKNGGISVRASQIPSAPITIQLRVVK